MTEYVITLVHQVCNREPTVKDGEKTSLLDMESDPHQFNTALVQLTYLIVARQGGFHRAKIPVTQSFMLIFFPWRTCPQIEKM